MTGSEVLFEELMGEATELTHGNGAWSFGQAWEYGLPGMTPPDGPDEAFSGPDGIIFATNLDGTAGKSNSTLTSPDFDASFITEGYYESIEVEFQNWRTFADGPWSSFSVSGEQILDTAELPNTSGWEKETVDVTEILVGAETGELKFSLIAFFAADGGGPGWNLDEIQVLGHGGPMAAPAPVAWLVAPEPASAGIPDAVYIAFSSPMKEEAFDEAGDLFSLAGPEGEVVLGDVTWVHESLLRLEVTQWAGFGSYTLTLNPGFQDVTGQEIDQNQNGIGGETPEDRMAFPFEFSLFAEPLPDTAYQGRLFSHEFIATEEVSAWSTADLPAWLEFRGDADGATLVGIPPASGPENESFTLTATTEHGAANASITLNLNEVPLTAWPEVSQSATAGFEGETASVSATVSGDGPFTLRILFDEADKGLFSEDWTDQIVVSVDAAGAVTEDIPFLVAGQTYTFRMQVENSLGTAIGEAVSFTMPGATPLQSWLAEFGYNEAELDTVTVIKGDREVTLREAYLLGEDPEDPDDVIRIREVAVQPDGETLQLRFPSLEGRVYQVEFSDDLNAEDWSVWHEELAGDDQIRIFELPLPDGAGDAQQFYRIRVSLPE
jgi:hypothetical protein